MSITIQYMKTISAEPWIKGRGSIVWENIHSNQMFTYISTYFLRQGYSTLKERILSNLRY